MRKDTLAGATCIYRRKNIDRALSANRPLSTPMYARRDFIREELRFRFNRNAMHAFV